MNRVFIRLYSFFCTIILVGTLVIFGVRIYRNSKQNLIEAEKNFKYIARFISASSETEYIVTDVFLRKVQDLCVLSGNIDKAMLANAENQTIFSWNAKDNTVNKVPYKVSNNSFVLKPYTMSISVKNPKTNDTKLYNFSALLKTISDDQLYKSIRDAFFVFAVLFLVTLMLLILSYLLNGKEARAVVNFDETELEEDTTTIEELKKPEQKNYSLDDLANVDFSASAVEASSFPNDYNIQTSDKSLAYPEGTFYNKTNEKADVAEQIRHGEHIFSPSENLKNESLVQEETNSEVENGNICGEAYFEEKLEYELGRATSAEQELSLIIFKLINVTEVELREIGKVLLAQFKIKEMLFQISELGFVVILHDANLDASMEAAEVAYSNIVEIIGEQKLGIGITTRSSRLVSAMRLVEEANSAVEKAFENSQAPIVAFRPDPKAYKDYLRDYT